MFTDVRHDLVHQIGERNSYHLHRAGYGTRHLHGYNYRDFGDRHEQIGRRHYHGYIRHCQARFKRSGLWQSGREIQ